ncbi:MAG TPA: TAXI family TRAP transporter solute-binding subunit [bacterium]|jgi:hypothetical protein|nr:TAXI family TRAP transporter solute-binding subunit [bacterium]
MRTARLGLWLAIVLLAALPLGTDAQQRANWPRSVAIGSASIGGVYFVIAGGYAKVIQEKLGVPSSVEVTGGPEQNIQLLAAKRIELGLATMGPLYEALRGIGWADHRYTDLRGAFPMYTSYVHWIVRADSPIRSIGDLNDKVVHLGPRGGTAEFFWPRVFNLFNIKPRRIVFGAIAEGANALRDGQIDGAFQVIGLPVPAWVELSATRPIRVMGLTPQQVETLVARFPYVSRSAIRAGVYRGQDAPLTTVAMWNAAIVHKDAADDFVYEMVKAMFANVELLATVHPAGAETLPVNIFYIDMPLHPGAVRYYTEQRIKLKDSQLPPR